MVVARVAVLLLAAATAERVGEHGAASQLSADTEETTAAAEVARLRAALDQAHAVFAKLAAAEQQGLRLESGWNLDLHKDVVEPLKMTFMQLGHSSSGVCCGVFGNGANHPPTGCVCGNICFKAKCDMDKFPNACDTCSL
mmetsp:Transcript_70021/g.193692  ORF Transcript_70021/g.193692 Transcript_70021/m.193692 type:complete len:140 (-) Transcript_70021:112-531(-)|eukprot:CAMPEP_0179201146 /NCGR_PEP_ID=MMETSP0796-20121207/100107_1 /TAXON_ID=73915 /ORGANISM="Pyrodinium bahamense, Strain pbaha01" /LENGTH=139 /DNA_ID=CAMNT_0020905703 /DNA_START=80 /DNA_END=499 /DNA_ORIENTATION=-